jgi:hypothetical protein
MSIQINYPKTSFVLADDDIEARLTLDASSVLLLDSSNKIAKLTSTSLSSTATTFDITVPKLSFGSTEGTANQVLTIDASGGAAHWQDPAVTAVPNIKAVLAVEDDSGGGFGDANQQSIKNLLSIQVKDANTTNPIKMTQNSGGIFDLTCDTSGAVIDDDKGTKQFSGNYMKVSLNGTSYYMPLFTIAP